MPHEATPRACARASILAPFRVSSFRFQWPADLATSWAFEMENLILAWYVLVETQSVLVLTVYATLLQLGTLLGPMFGVAGDRVGQRTLLAGMRAVYVSLATTIMILAFAGRLSPYYVLALAAVSGLVRPSDIGIRAALIGETVPGSLLMAAMGIQRTTQDSARIVGALSGAGLVAALGIGPAYAVVAGFYVAGLALTLVPGVRLGRPQVASRSSARPRPSPWSDLKEGLAYVWNTPLLLALMCYALLLNGTVFPLFNALLPVVAKEVYQAGQTTLGYMLACASGGALAGALAVSRFGGVARPMRLAFYAGAGWFAMMLVFAQVTQPVLGMAVLACAGIAQTAGLVPLSTVLLRHSEQQFRGRIMGIRMLVIYANVPGLLLFGPLFAAFGYALTATLYCLFGLAVSALIVLRWRDCLWSSRARANTR
ncbi:MAG: MFS transporter [Burkholderiales bacterium]|nr:MFS transporter [Burkholderiales bacterium]